MTAPTYHALKDLHAATCKGGGLLPSPWDPADRETTYEALWNFFPPGTEVTAVYAAMSDLTTFRTYTGTVTSHARIAIDEPHFHIEDSRGFTILLPGSLLTIKEPAATA